MKISVKIMLSAFVALVGFLLKEMGSILGYILFYIGFCATIIFTTKWLNSTNRK